jgi:hypothetical protein
LLQSVHSYIAGYEDVNGAERLSQDPTFGLEQEDPLGTAGWTFRKEG